MESLRYRSTIQKWGIFAASSMRYLVKSNFKHRSLCNRINAGRHINPDFLFENAVATFS